MIVALHIIVLCRFTLRSYANNVLPVSYSWSTFTGPVSGEVHEVSSNDENYSNYGPDYVAKPDYSFAYGVDNPKTGDSHGHSETREGSTVTGEYSVMEPDGVLRRVLYTSDPKNGFRASVRFVQPDGESVNHDHGYHYGYNPSESNSSPPSEYESNDDYEQYTTSSPSSLLSSNFGYDDKYNNNKNNDNNDINDNDDYEDDNKLSMFKFPFSSPSPLKNTVDKDSNDYDVNEKYYHWDTLHSSTKVFDSTPSSPSPFAPRSSPSPLDSASLLDHPSPYDPPSSPSLFNLLSSPSSLFKGPTSPPLFKGGISRHQTEQPCEPPSSISTLSADKVTYHKTTDRSYGFGRLPSVDDDDDELLSGFRSSLLNNFDDDRDEYLRENYESGDNDDEDIVEQSPSIVQSSRPQSVASTWLPTVITAASTPLLRTTWPSMSSRPINVADLSPSSPSMIPIEPTIIDIGV